MIVLLGFDESNAMKFDQFVYDVRAPGEITQTFASVHDAQAFGRFRALASTLTNHDSGNFWNQLVLQFCHADGAIKHLVIAAGLLDQDMSFVVPVEPNRPGFLQHYSRALGLLANQPKLDSNVTLMACLLMCFCEDMRSHGFSALQHLHAGRRILQEEPGMTLLTTQRERRGKPDPLRQKLLDIFVDLEAHTSTFDRETIPSHLRLPLSGFTGIAGRVKAQRREQDRLAPPRRSSTHNSTSTTVSVNDVSAHTNSPSSVFFSSIQAANHRLQELIPACLSRTTPCIIPRSRFVAVSWVTTSLNEWLVAFNHLLASLSVKVDLNTLVDIHLLRTYHQCLSVASRTFPYDRDIYSDVHQPVYEHILFKASLLVHVADDLELAPLFFFLALHCRDPVIRSRSVANLQSCGLDGLSLALVAQRVVSIEESPGAPDSNRIRVVSVHPVPDRTGAYLCFFRHHPPPAPLETCWIDFGAVAERDVDWATKLKPRFRKAVTFDWSARPI